MSRVPALTVGLLTSLLALPLLSCSDDGSADGAARVDVLGEGKAQAALLTLEDLGAGYERQPSGEEGENDGLDCLSRAARDFAAVQGATELEVEYRRPGAAGSASEVSVLSSFSSFAEPDRAETALDELRGALQDCRTAEYEDGDTSISFDISVSDDRTDDSLDQQVNVTLDGEIVTGRSVVPLLIELRYFRVANHDGAVSVSLLNTPDGAGEVDRLVERGVERFLKVTDEPT